MIIRTQNRREFLRVSATSPALLPFFAPFARTLADDTPAKNDRPRLGLIWRPAARGRAMLTRPQHRHGDFLAVCDVDRRHAERAKKDQRIGKEKADIYEDYRKVLDRKDIDAVIIGTPDHWHTKICIDAMKAGKDIYCEKPLTLTIDEGKKLGQVAKETNRVVQVGTQQRSDHNRVFLLAVAMVRSGRIGKIKKVTAAIGKEPPGGPFPATNPPTELNWDMWLGQAPKVAYREQRCHGTFRWWYEYSGGKAHRLGHPTMSTSANGPLAWRIPVRIRSRSSKGCCRSSSSGATRRWTTATTQPPNSSSAPGSRTALSWISVMTRKTESGSRAQAVRSSSLVTGSTWRAARSMHFIKTRCPSRS